MSINALFKNQVILASMQAFFRFFSSFFSVKHYIHKTQNE